MTSYPTDTASPTTLKALRAIVEHPRFIALGAVASRVLLALVVHADYRTRIARPSVKRLAHLVGSKRQNVRLALEQLARLGFIERVELGGGRGHRAGWRLLVPLAETGPAGEPLSSDEKGVPSGPERGPARAVKGSPPGRKGVPAEGPELSEQSRTPSNSAAPRRMDGSASPSNGKAASRRKGRAAPELAAWGEKLARRAGTLLAGLRDADREKLAHLFAQETPRDADFAERLVALLEYKRRDGKPAEFGFVRWAFEHPNEVRFPAALAEDAEEGGADERSLEALPAFRHPTPEEEAAAEIEGFVKCGYPRPMAERLVRNKAPARNGQAHNR